MVYCALSLRIIGSIYINYFETPTNQNYVGHNPKKRYPCPAISLKINRLGLTMMWPCDSKRSVVVKTGFVV